MSVSGDEAPPRRRWTVGGEGGLAGEGDLSGVIRVEPAFFEKVVAMEGGFLPRTEMGVPVFLAALRARGGVAGSRGRGVGLIREGAIRRRVGAGRRKFVCAGKERERGNLRGALEQSNRGRAVNKGKPEKPDVERLGRLLKGRVS